MTPATVERYQEVLARSQLADRAALSRGEADVRPLTEAETALMIERYAAKRERRIVKAGPGGFGSRRSDERAYERVLHRIVLGPLMRQLRSGLSRAAATSQAISALDGVDWQLPEGLVAEEVSAQAARLNGYHRNRLIQTFRSALGVDIRPTLDDDAIRPLMDAWRRENVSLIRTVPRRLHDGLYRGISTTFAGRPFDQQALSRVVSSQVQSSGYNLRRITRDQTSKAIGQLTQARHRQIGITDYTWRTAQDERVRPGHAALDGTRQRYDDPPSVGNPGDGIMCRCMAIPHIPEAMGETQLPIAGVRASEVLPPGLAFEGFAAEAAARFAARTQTFTRHPDFVDYRSIEALRRYTGAAHRDYNRRLRERVPLSAFQRDMHEGLFDLYRPLGENMVTFRGLGGPMPFYKGQRLLQRAPVSSSIDPDVPLKSFSGDNVMVEIHAKAAAKAIRTNRDDQFEVVFQDGQSLRVIDVLYNVEILGRRVIKYVTAALE